MQVEDGRWKMAGNKIRSFEDLEVWNVAQDLAVKVYEITKTFPRDEMFALTNQLRRSAYSISANIAEGFGRQTKRDKLHFYTIAYGSLLEVKNFLYLSNKLGYIDIPALKDVIDHTTSCQKLVNAFKAGLN